MPRPVPKPIPGARLTRRQLDSTRAQIQSTQIIRRLQAHGMGRKLDGKKVSLLDSQVRCLFGLLNKVVPDVQRTEVSGPDGGDIPIPKDAPGLDGVKALLAGMMASAIKKPDGEDGGSSAAT